MSRLTSYRSKHVSLDFRGGRPNASAGTRLDLLTGPNGSGKTEVLSQIARAARNGGKATQAQIEWSSSPFSTASAEDVPERVIAQTFSPFSRFPRPRRELSLYEVYAQGVSQQERYRTVGISRGIAFFSANVARNVLEKSLYRLSEERPKSEAIFDVLRQVGFSDALRLVYEPVSAFRELRQAHADGKLESFVSEALRRDVNMQRDVLSQSLRAELSRTPVAHMVALLQEAIPLVEREKGGRKGFQVELSLMRPRSTMDFAMFQAAALFRRLRVFRLRECHLRRADGSQLEIAAASSGQQQLLCSTVGLAAELRPGSLVLIDEPELSLHPSWQATFIDRLLEIAHPFPGTHILLATHSPLLVQRAIQLRHSVHVLGLGGGTDILGRASPAASGQRLSVDEALVEVFETPVSSSLYVANELFSIITDAEAEDADRLASARARLMRLQSVYGERGDLRTKELISKAEKLLESAGQQGGDEKNG
jgi:predicted ATPase